MRGNEVNIDNSSVVPYNPVLLLRYQAHVNVEVVHSVQAVKYLYKYITKGQDRVILSMRGDGGDEPALDEVETYLNARYISASQSELYYLRMLLHNKAEAQSYEDLRTIDGHICPTFQDACRSMGLLEDDSERDAAMTEAASIRFGSHLRDLFANILIHCKPTNPLEFYERHKLELCRDIMLREGTSTPTEAIHNQVLLDLKRKSCT